MPTLNTSLSLLAGAAIFAVLPLRAEVRLPAIFGDHMVLQQDRKLPIWGWADAGENVTVTLANRTGSATAGADGRWRLELEPLPANASPAQLTIKGKGVTLSFGDVLVGDVWVCSGQSNMEFSLGKAAEAAEVVPKANDPGLRYFRVERRVATEPETKVAGKWVVCTPQTAPEFSAVAYFFGRDLREHVKHPIGLIGTFWGGTWAASWISLPGLSEAPAFDFYVQSFERAKHTMDAAANPTSDAGQYQKAYDDWQKAAVAARRAGLPIPTKPAAPAGAKPMADVSHQEQIPAGLFNGMVAPLTPYAIKGVAWYQGESNMGNNPEYYKLFPRLIEDWRARWAQKDLPFVYVQLPRFESGTKTWPFIRDAQLKALSLPNTGMAIALDVGDPANIHPKGKSDVGHRLALAARHVAYGETVAASGPLYDSMTLDGSRVRLTFKDTAGGLKIGVPPWTPAGVTPPPATELRGFVIAGKDAQWLPAQAKIEGGKVVVWSDQVPSPVAVRYAWADNPEANLYNSENLPASPFRTDDWKLFP